MAITRSKRRSSPFRRQVLRIAQRVPLADVGAGDAVQDHVHLADGPGAAVELLAEERQVAAVAARLFHLPLGLDQQAAGAAGRVVDRHAGPRRDDQRQQPRHLGRRVELAALLARAVGEILDQVLVGRAQQVGELERVGVQGDAVEVLDELDQGGVVQGALAHAAVEVDPLQHVLQRVGVGVLDRGQRLVQRRPDALLGVAHRGPAGLVGHEEVVLVGVDQQGIAGGCGQVIRLQLAAQPGLLDLELVVEVLEEEHAEDILFVLAGVHVPAQDVAGFEEQALQAGEGELVVGQRCLRSRASLR